MTVTFLDYCIVKVCFHFAFLKTDLLKDNLLKFHPLKVYKSMDVNIPTALYTHHHSPMLEHVHHPKMKCVPNLSHSFFSSPPAFSIIIGGDHSVCSLLSLAALTHHNDAKGRGSGGR